MNYTNDATFSWKIVSIVEDNSMNAHQATTVREEYCTFIGKNAEKYLTKFQQFQVNGGDQFSVTWHWPAFLFPFFWMVYRKLYLWALLVLVLGVTIGRISSIGVLIPMVIFGITANYIYYKHMKKKLLELQQLKPAPEPQSAAIARTGGVNNRALVVVLMVGSIAAIAVPNLLTAIQRAKRRGTVGDMRVIGTALGCFHVDNTVFPVQTRPGAFSHIAYQSSVDAGMTTAYYAGPDKDAWGTPYIYWSDGTTYTLLSYGKDQEEGKRSGEFDEDIMYSDGRFLAPDDVTRY